MVLGTDDEQRYYEFELDSADSAKPYSKSFTNRDWPNFRIGGKRQLNDIAGIKLIEAQIPFSWYLFNGTDMLVVNDTVANQTFNLTIGNGPGNYSVADIVASTNTSSAYQWQYTNSTQKLGLNAKNGNVFTLITGSTTLAYLLGLAPNVLYTSTAGQLIFPNIAQVTGPNYLYLCSKSIGNLTDLYLPESIRPTEGNSGPEMAKIPVNVLPGDVIFYSDPDPTKYFNLEGLNNLPELDFYLTLGIPGALDQPLILNGGSFSLKIGITAYDYDCPQYSSGTERDDRTAKRMRRR